MTSKLPVELLAGSGTSGQVLTSNGTGSSPSMQDISVGIGAVTEYFLIDIGDETTALTTGTGKKTFRIPLNLDVSEVRASVTTAPTGANLVVDFNADGTSIFDTDKINIDVSETTSLDSATQPTIINDKIFNNTEVTVDIDQIGSTVAGAGLKLQIIGTEFDINGTLDAFVASTCGELDATLSASYGGSGQTWASVTASPADGASQTDYDFFLGETGTATSDDPTFTGSAGDSGAYFLMDGGDHFLQKTNTTLINRLQADNGQDWWMVFAFHWPSTATSTNPILYATGGLPAETGIEIFIGSSGNGPAIRTRLNHNRGSTRTVNNFNGAGYFVPGNDYLIGFTFDSGADTITHFRNLATPETSGDINSDTGTANSTYNASLGRRGGGGNNLSNNFRVYHASFGNGLLTSGQFSNIKNVLESRHGRTYNAS
jgi:hypothetical protein